jgi:hypothetical protein
MQKEYRVFFHDHDRKETTLNFDTLQELGQFLATYPNDEQWPIKKIEVYLAPKG